MIRVSGGGIAPEAGMDRATEGQLACAATSALRPSASEQNAIMRSKRETEREISQAIIRFEKEFMGRGPLETRSYIIDDMVLVRLKNVLTPAELKLAESEDRERGRYLIKQMRQELIERGRPLLDAVIKDVLAVNVISLHTDISAKTGERIIVFTLEQTPRCADNR